MFEGIDKRRHVERLFGPISGSYTKSYIRMEFVDKDEFHLITHMKYFESSNSLR